MAYLTCPWCLTPQLIADEAAEYTCYTCAAEIRFFQCPNCSTVQSVNERWRAFTCASCNAKVDLPHRWGYDRNATGLPLPCDREVLAAALISARRRGGDTPTTRGTTRTARAPSSRRS